MKKIGVGMIGYGGFGEFLAEAFLSMPQLKITAICDVSSGQRQLAEQRLGVRTYSEGYELIKDPEVDIVVISTPPYTHAGYCVAAANNKKHIFCEKPMGTSLAEADAIIRAVEANGVRLILDYVQRYNPINRKLKELFHMDILGPTTHQSIENYASDELLKPAHWFWDKSKSGGVWVEHGVHFFDLFSWLTGEQALDGFSVEANRFDGVADKSCGIVRYSGGILGTFTHFFTQPQRFEETTMKFTCARGYTVLRGWVPLRMKLDVLVDEREYEILQEWAQEYISDAKILETYSGDNMNGWSSGKPYTVKYRAKVNLELPQNKYETYQECVRLAMLDLIFAIRDSEYVQRVTMQDGRESLRTALLLARFAGL
ncbi:MAG: Gfo/Idh/MocA family oxidoreductase [Bacillota bacterium]